jgi:p-aminobenzoyl-glutamate transporter AbgT
MIFVIALAISWVLSAMLGPITFAEIDPRSGKPLQVVNQLTAPALASFLANMVQAFTAFPPLGLVLVALLGVGVAEHTGFINAGLKAFARRHAAPAAEADGHPGPLAGIAAGFAGVSGGFSADFISSALDPLLQGFTQSAARS